MCRAQAVGARVAAPDDDHAFARGQDLVLHAVAGPHAVLLGQVFHGEVNAFQLASGHFQVARAFGSSGQQDGIELLPQVLSRHVVAHVRVGLELDAFQLHLVEPAVDRVLLELEVRNPVAQQPADAVRLLEDGHRVPGTIQLLGRGQTRGPRAHHRHPLARAAPRRFRDDPTFAEGVFDDGLLDLP